MERTEATMTEAQLVAIWRKQHPRSRVRGIIRYVANGSIRRQRGCVLCGQSGPTWCGRWPKTAQAEAWEREHVAQHVAQHAE